MGSRLLPLSLVLAALAAGASGVDGIAALLVLGAIPCAAAASFVAISDALEGRDARLRAVSTSLALALLVVGSTSRAHAPVGAHVPALAVSTLVLAVIVYTVPAVVWLVEPLRPHRRPARARVRIAPDQ